VWSCCWGVSKAPGGANMRRRHPESVELGSRGSLWDLVPDGAAVWRACRRHIKARRYSPLGWSWPDWREEIEAVCLARAFEALDRFDPERGVPLAAFLCTEVHYAVSEYYRAESRFAAHCHATSVAIQEPGIWEENIGSEDGIAAWQAMRALPDGVRLLLERLVVKGESEARIACELGVSRATISRRKQAALVQLRARCSTVKQKKVYAGMNKYRPSIITNNYRVQGVSSSVS
jgi:RNA polymerase sigma factor (sigma-70 family)